MNKNSNIKKHTELFNLLNKKDILIKSKYTKDYLYNLRLNLKNNDSSDEEKIKKILVLNGGGIKGICFLGALHYLYETKYILNFDIFIGTSVSSLILFICLLGYTPQDLMYFVYNYNFKEFKNFNIDKLFINYGLNDGSEVINIIERFLIEKKLTRDLTFEEFNKINNKLFIVTGTNLNKKHCEYFSFLTTPKMKIIDAIRISTSMPVIFDIVNYNNEYYVDGSCSDDLAIDCVFNNPFVDYITKNIRLEEIKNKTLSIYLDDVQNSFNSLLSYGFCILNTLIGKNIDYNKISVVIDTHNIKSFNFNLSNELKIKLFNIGFDSMIKYFN